jgi:transglutaminase-like putative cysteine protease
MQRQVTARIGAQVRQPAEIVLAVAAASGHEIASEHLVATVDGVPVQVTEVPDRHGTRLHVLSPGPVGLLDVSYDAEVGERLPSPGNGSWPAERIEYIRPSRYAESDRLAAISENAFGEREGKDLLDAVSSWVGVRLAYVSGSSRPTDGAVDTYLARQGVCRDFAHLAVALLRARNVPARLAAVYAPGLQPMDFHAVTEAWVEDDWHVIDPTALAPRGSLVRIATGRDAADTAFMTVQSGLVDLLSVQVTAVTEGALPLDDVTRLARLG